MIPLFLYVILAVLLLFQGLYIVIYSLFLFKKFTLPAQIKRYRDLLKVSPDNPELNFRLGDLFYFGMVNDSQKLRGTYAEQALEHYERAYIRDRKTHQYECLKKLSRLSVETGNLDKAHKYATELWTSAPQFPDYTEGNALHFACTEMGRIALREGKIAVAEECLLESINVPMSPLLTAAGPSMLLASELLEREAYDTVSKYLDACTKLQTRYNKKFRYWKQQVDNKTMPHFGKNLLL